MVPPESIDCERHFLSSFGHYETEHSANVIVRYMRHLGLGWQPFTYAQIDEFYRTHCRVIPFPPPPLTREQFSKIWESLGELPIGNFRPGRHEHFLFYDLVDGNMIQTRGDAYVVTQEFVDRCHRASPVRES